MIKILTTGRKLNERNFHEVVVQQDGSLLITKHKCPKFDQVQLIRCLGGNRAVIDRCFEFQGTLEEYVAGVYAEAKAAGIVATALRNEKLDAAWREAHEVKLTATPQELYRLFVQINQFEKHDSRFCADFFFLETNPLSTAICDKIGSYTVNPFDDGAVNLNTRDGKRYSNHRKYAKSGSIADLIGAEL